MPESFIPVWMSIGEAEEFRRFLQDEARSDDGEFPEREYSLIEGAIEEERPRTFDQMQAEQEARDILESIQGDAYLWQIDDSPWDTPEEVIERLRQTARDGLRKLDAAPTQQQSSDQKRGKG